MTSWLKSPTPADSLRLKNRSHERVCVGYGSFQPAPSRTSTGTRTFGSNRPNQVAITIITAEEHLRGRLAQVNKAAAGDTRATAYAYLHKAISDLAKLNILDYDTVADTIYQELKRQRLRIGSQDLRIAAITLAHQGCLLTRNRSDFGRISGLTYEDWSI
jgi:tRNA(fMet)-specific endonuclease VapC